MSDTGDTGDTTPTPAPEPAPALDPAPTAAEAYPDSMIQSIDRGGQSPDTVTRIVHYRSDHDA